MNLAATSIAETDSGPTRLSPGTERLCVATRTVRPVSDMIRFVAGPDGAVVPDLKRRLPGRGVWVTADRATLADAIKRRAFARGLRQDVMIGPELLELVENLLERAALDALGIAHKAGSVVAGFAKVEAALGSAAVVGLLHAREAGADGVRKITAAARRRSADGADRIPVVEAFTSVQLDLALGRANVIHAALLAGSASDGFLARCRGLERFRTVDPSRPG
jgi:predicted RNA-binding protein YlxR (DUF448 family)